MEDTINSLSEDNKALREDLHAMYAEKIAEQVSAPQAYLEMAESFKFAGKQELLEQGYMPGSMTPEMLTAQATLEQMRADNNRNAALIAGTMNLAQTAYGNLNEKGNIILNKGLSILSANQNPFGGSLFFEEGDFSAGGGDFPQGEGEGAAPAATVTGNGQPPDAGASTMTMEVPTATDRRRGRRRRQ